MPGIITTSTNIGGSMTVYRCAFTTTSTSLAINWVSGTTAAAAGPVDPSDKGVEVTFQNQSSGAVNVWIGGANMVPSIGTTSTLGVGGIILAQNGTFSVGHRHAPSAVQLPQWYVSSTSSVAVAVAFLVRAV